MFSKKALLSEQRFSQLNRLVGFPAAAVGPDCCNRAISAIVSPANYTNTLPGGTVRSYHNLSCFFLSKLGGFEAKVLLGTLFDRSACPWFLHLPTNGLEIQHYPIK
jgi:hypothetical protein